MKLKKLLFIISIIYLIFVSYLANISTFQEDEGTHSLLGIFYIDLFKYAIAHPSFSDIYNYGYAYLVYYPKLSVYYPPLTHLEISSFFLIFGKSYVIARMVPIIFSFLFILSSLRLLLSLP